MARSYSSPVYNSRRMCQGLTPILDPNLWSFVFDHLRSWSTVHKLYLDYSLQVHRNHSLSNDIFPSTVKWPGGEVPPSSCLLELYCLEQTGSIIYPWYNLVFGVFPERILLYRLRSSFWFTAWSARRVAG